MYVKGMCKGNISHCTVDKHRKTTGTYNVRALFWQVVDLLIAMANTAANSSRAMHILDPFPSIVDPNKVHTLALDPQVLYKDILTLRVHAFIYVYVANSIQQDKSCPVLPTTVHWDIGNPICPIGTVGFPGMSFWSTACDIYVVHWDPMGHPTL